MQRSLRSRSLLLFALLAIAAFVATPPLARSDDGKVTNGLKSFGKKVGEKSVEAGHAIAGVAKKVWYKGKQVSAPLLHNVQRATRRFWDDVIKGKDKSIDALKDENDKLKDQVEEGDD